MSLSFVSSSVQTGRSDGGYDEVAIESKEKEAVNKRNQHKPLFEQLRQNQEEEDAKQEEMQLQMLRGTCALNEDDVAHLDALEKQRLAKEHDIQQRTRDEIALFRAARAEQQQTTLDDDDDDDDENDGDIVLLSQKKPKATESETSKAIAPAAKKGPIVVVKKRKRKGAAPEPTKKTKAPESSEKKESQDTKEHRKEAKEEKSSQGGGLGGLLGGYGSSDEDSD